LVRARPAAGLVQVAHYRPRAVLSTAEIRNLVVPMRPEGTDALDEAALADLVTRDSMIGAGLALVP
jgi:nitrile hydratase